MENNINRNFKKFNTRFLKTIFQMRSSVVIILIIISVIILRILSPSFLSLRSIQSLSIALSLEIPVVVGMAILLISGGFDLSVGSVSALSMVITGICLVKGLNIFISVLLGLLSGAAIGLLNGVLISRLKINALIVTLGTMTIARGIPLVMTGGQITIGFPKSFSILANEKVGGIFIPVVIALAIAVIADLSLRNIRTFRQIYYVGGNEKAAIFSGINVNRIRVYVYLLSGIFAALNGIILSSRIMSATPLVNPDLALRVIAAAIIGGCTLAGGEGSVLGACLGLIFMFIISSAMVFLGISVYWQGIVVGAILIIAVAIDVLTREKEKI